MMKTHLYYTLVDGEVQDYGIVTLCDDCAHPHRTPTGELITYERSGGAREYAEDSCEKCERD